MGSEERGPKTLQELLAERLRELRLAHRARQEDVARGAVALGLDWTRSTVAAIEAGRRVLTLEETLLLPAIVGLGYGAAVRLGDLLTPSGQAQGFPGWHDEQVALTPLLTVSLSEIVHALESPTWAGVAFRAPAASMVSEAEAQLGDGRAPGGGLIRWRLQRVKRDALGLAEQHAARKLRISPLAVSVAAYLLWDRSLSDERDRRVSEQGEAPPRTLQARRGHITRAMLAEIRRAFPDLKRLEREAAETAEAEGGVGLPERLRGMEDRLTELEQRAAAKASTARPGRLSRESNG
jgi:transcriptional regulator with XRE-family HTH domain